LTFEIFVSRNIKADREFVFDWWTDLSPDDTKLVKPLKSREILSRSPERILLRDEEQIYFRKMQFDVEVTLHRPEMWSSNYEGKSATARSDYRLLAETDGTTTLNYSTRIEPHGFLTSIFSPVVKPFVKKVFVGEMDIFIRTLERDYTKQKIVD